MKTLELKEKLYWAGILDKDLKVFDIIMETEFGTTYNSYIIKGSEKTALIETAKAKFIDVYLDKIGEITDIDKIDYIVVSHTEPDHAGSVERLIELNPDIEIVGTPVAINFLENIVNKKFKSRPAKENEPLTLGDKTLRFITAPNLHWPDTMYTYSEEDKTLFTCDSFGCHYSFEDILFSKVKDMEGYERAARYYFDNILGPFKPYMKKAIAKIENLDIDMICTGHGPVLDCDIKKIIKKYDDWCTVINPNKNKTVIIPYVSAYGYTKILAEEITKGIKNSGEIDVRLYDMVEADYNEVMSEIGFADGILFGTPTVLNEALKPIWEITNSMYPIIHGGKLASSFGSYGWSGEGVDHIIERLKQLKMKTLEGFKIKFKPSEAEIKMAYDYGCNFAKELRNHIE